jgi:hypothetical protein
MVRFEERKLIIEVETITPVETWLDMHQSLCDVVRFVKQDTIVDDTFFAAVDLLAEMMPDWKTGKKMQ